MQRIAQKHAARKMGGVLALAISLSLLMTITLQPATAYAANAPYPACLPLPKTLSGSYAEDILSVALSQVGYHEAANGGTCYSKSTAAWCAYFISWCAEKANIPSSIIPYGVGSSYGFDNIGKNHKNEKDYEAKPGDIAVYYDGKAHYHVGLVYGWDKKGKFAYTIEGNLSNKVKKSNTRDYLNAQRRHVPVFYVTPNYNPGTATVAMASCTASSAQLKWGNALYSSGYEVYRSESKDRNFALIASVTAPTCLDKGLAQNKTYYYKVKAFRALGSGKLYGAFSNVVIRPARSYT